MPKLAIVIVLALIVLPLAVHGDDATSKTTFREVNASDILPMVQKGETVEYDHVIVKGNLDLSQSDLPTKRVSRTHTEKLRGFSETRKIINSHIKITDSIFDGFVSFNDTFLNESIDLSGSNFAKNVHFVYSEFNGTAYFRNSTFNSIADFRNSKFNDEARFETPTFNDNVSFRDAYFSRDAYFYTPDLNIQLNLYSNTTLNNDSDFSYITFNGYAYFWGAMFNGYANFQNTTFNGGSSFWNAEFNDDANFNFASFKERALFDNTKFHRSLGLWDTKYDLLFIRWNNIDNLVYDEPSYQKLLENFKKLGFDRDADSCYYEFRLNLLLNWRPSHEIGDYNIAILLRDINKKYIMSYLGGIGDWLMYCLDFGAWVFYGYGKKPLYPVEWSIGIVLLFGIIWVTGGLKSGRGIIEKYGPDNLGKNWRSQIQVLADAMIFSTTIFLSGTRFFIDPPELPEMPRWSRSWTRVVFVTERVLGGFFSILFFLAIGATVVR